jgi:POT family proton-dependent oligopeptide transporter
MNKPASQILGHPRGLAFLFATEMWERFSYYGMRALLVLYMVHELLLPENESKVLGLATLRHLLEGVSGPLGPQPFASQIYGLYSGLFYLTPIFGGLVADRWLGRRRTVVLGAAMMVAGHFLMALPSMFLAALLLLVIGNGAFKPNVVTQVGGLYAESDPRRDRAYSIFYVGINVGAFFSPLVCGTLGEMLGWHVGFLSAGVGMAVGLATYLVGLPNLPPDRKATGGTPADPKQLGPALLAIAFLFIPATMFWAAYEQQGNTIALWADSLTDRSFRVGPWQGNIPVTWFQAFNPLMIFLFTPLLVRFWSLQAQRRREPDTVLKLSLGCLILSAGYLIMALAGWLSGGEKMSWLWLVAYFVVLTVGELYFSPISLSLMSQIAPAGHGSLVMGVWLVSTFTGNLSAGLLGSLWSSLTPAAYFLLVAGLAASGGLLILMSRGRLANLVAGQTGSSGMESPAVSN